MAAPQQNLPYGVPPSSVVPGSLVLRPAVCPSSENKHAALGLVEKDKEM